jgi:hypothetical protein
MSAHRYDCCKSSGTDLPGRPYVANGAARAGERHGGFWTTRLRSDDIHPAANAAGRVEVGFIALWTTGHAKRPNRKARPHDRLVTRVGAQVASQRCPILRAGERNIPQDDSAGGESVRGH